MTGRHPHDCYLTPPCAALAVSHWLDRCVSGPVLDPFAGAGTLLAWATADGLREGYAMEIDARWAPELHARLHPLNIHIGRDAFEMPWLTRAGPPHILTNPPFGRVQDAVERCRRHARAHGRWACVLMRTDWWQHRDRSSLRPDHMLMLEWRPVFGLNKRGAFSTDYAGYVWCVYEPRPTGRTVVEFLARPGVPPELVAEHRRLARLAHQMGADMAHGG